MKADDKCFQLYKFIQSNDGSIYCNFPEFSNIQWKCFEFNGGEISVRLEEPLNEEGKLSIHGSGMVTYRSNVTARVTPYCNLRCSSLSLA